MRKLRNVRTRRIGVSAIIALLLVASGAVRMLDGTGAAIAREVSLIIPDGSDLDQSRPAAMVCPDDADLNRIMETLKARETSLAEREQRAEARTRELNEASALLSDQMKSLEEAESDLRATIADAEEAAESDISQLTAVYENMKPKEAAAVFEQMAPEFAAGFLGRMRSDAAARILAGLEPGTAYSVSVILASRNMEVPTK